MSSALLFGCLWVLAATATALLPMRRQMVPGIALLIAAPFLLIWIGLGHGAGWALAACLAFVSMFRNPLIYFARRALGRPAPLPRDLTAEKRS